jgi:hypothetical protein
MKPVVNIDNSIYESPFTAEGVEIAEKAQRITRH